MLGKFFRISLNDDERQTLTTFSMMFGTMALTLVITGMVLLQRYSWSAETIALHAPVIINGLFHVTYGLLALMGIMIVAQAVIAIGGKMKGAFGPASFEAEAENATVRIKGPIDAQSAD